MGQRRGRIPWKRSSCELFQRLETKNMMRAQMRELSKEPNKKALTNLTPRVFSARRISGEPVTLGEEPWSSENTSWCEKGWAGLLIRIPPLFPVPQESAFLPPSIPRGNLLPSSIRGAKPPESFREARHAIDRTCHLQRLSQLPIKWVPLSPVLSFSFSSMATAGFGSSRVMGLQDPCRSFLRHGLKGSEKGRLSDSGYLGKGLPRRCNSEREQGEGRIWSLFSEPFLS
mgnify:CR=1 FL=1